MHAPFGKKPRAFVDLGKAFEQLEEAAAQGLRCPENGVGHLRNGAVSKLCRIGKVRSEVYRENYRVVTILHGPHAGKSTRRPPFIGEPYRVIGRDPAKYDPQGAISKPASRDALLEKLRAMNHR